MAEVLVLSEADVAGLLDLERLLPRSARPCRLPAPGRPRRRRRSRPGPRAAAGGHAGAAQVALGAKLVSVFPANHERGRPSHQALIALFDPDDGTPVAVMDGTRITAARTGARPRWRLAPCPGRRGVLAILARRTGCSTWTRSRWCATSATSAWPPAPLPADALAAAHPAARAVASFEEAVTGADVGLLLHRRPRTHPGAGAGSPPAPT